MEVHIVTDADRPTYAAALAAMHRQRARIFVDALGWRDLYARHGEEADAFDGPDATYLLAMDAGGQVRGSLRLLPTTGDHLLAGPLSRFVDGDLPRGPSIREWSRHAPGLPEWPPEVNAAARAALHLGALEYAAREGVTAYTAVIETWLLRRARALGWACTPLGPAIRYGEGEAVAVLNPVAPGHLEALRAKLGAAAPVLAGTRVRA